MLALFSFDKKQKLSCELLKTHLSPLSYGDCLEDKKIHLYTQS